MTRMARTGRLARGEALAGEATCSTPYCVSFVRGARGLGELWSDWRSLTAAAPPFLQPEFFDLTLPIVDPAGEPLLAVAMVGERTAGVLPLVLHHRDLYPLRSSHSPRFDFYGGSAAISGIWEALDADTRWDRLILGNIPIDSPLLAELPMIARHHGCCVQASPSDEVPYFSLQGFEDRLSPKFRTNLRRCMRKAGDVRLERCLTPSQKDLEDALAIEAMAWKHQAGTSIDSDPRRCEFYRALMRVFGPRGTMSLNFASMDGQRVACLFTMEDAHTLFAAKIGYDPAFSAISPGHLMIALTAADAEKRGLTMFDFLGTTADAWKLKWTDRVRPHPWVTLIRPSVRPYSKLVWQKVRKHAASRTPNGQSQPKARTGGGQHHPGQAMLFTPLLPAIPYLIERCQRFNMVGQHSLRERIKGRVGQGLGIKSGIRRLLQLAPEPRSTDPLGPPSRFAEGSWVRVRDEASIRQTLDTHACLRGLRFSPGQWTTCSKVYRVAKVVRRIIDDERRMRPVARTIYLEGSGVDCTGNGTGEACGRYCPMFYRDEWLEPSDPPAQQQDGPQGQVHYARIRPLGQILDRLDLLGQRQGLMFMPEMGRYAGMRVRVFGRISRALEYYRWVDVLVPVYILEGLHCTGASLGSDGPCDRGCHLLWHVDWLEFED